MLPRSHKLRGLNQTWMQVSIASEITEHSVQILADRHPIWFSGWVLLHGQDNFCLEVCLLWFKQSLNVYFPVVLHSPTKTVFPAYSAGMAYYPEVSKFDGASLHMLLSQSNLHIQCSGRGL